MLNYLGVDNDTIDYVVDRNVHKQGRTVPGARLLIRDPSYLLEDQPDYVLILPWNFQKEIVSQQAKYAQAGGKFIIPIPTPQVL